MAACQFGRAYGLDVVGTAGSDAGQAFVLSCGAQAAFNHNEEGYVQKIEVRRTNRCVGEGNVTL